LNIEERQLNYPISTLLTVVDVIDGN